MKKSLLIIFLCTLSFSVFAQKPTKKYADVILKLHNKGYNFFALKEEEVFFLTGSSERIEMTFNEFIRPVTFQSYKVELSPDGIVLDVLKFTKDGYKIVIRKDQKFYEIANSKFVKFDAKNYQKEIPVKLIKTRTVEKTHCAYCTFNLSSNYVQIEDKVQFSSEISWLPYWRLGDTTGLRLSLSVSPYSTEDDNLKKVVSFALKTQLLLRQYAGLFFFDIGGGSHYFIDYQMSLRILTGGMGYTFAEKHFFFTEKIRFSSLYFHYSTINWVTPINEYKLGVSINF